MGTLEASTKAVKLSKKADEFEFGVELDRKFGELKEGQ